MSAAPAQGSPVQETFLPPCFTISHLDNMAMESQVLRDRGLAGFVNPTLLRAHKASSWKIYHCTWMAYITWYKTHQERLGGLCHYFPMDLANDCSGVCHYRLGFPLPHYSTFHQGALCLLGILTSGVCVSGLHGSYVVICAYISMFYKVNVFTSSDAWFFRPLFEVSLFSPFEWHFPSGCIVCQFYFWSFPIPH